MALVNPEGLEFDAEAYSREDAAGFRATGAVLFMTWDRRRPMAVCAAGTWPQATVTGGRGGSHHVVARAAMWLLGR